MIQLIQKIMQCLKKNITDCWIHVELNLPQGEKLKCVKVIGRSKNEDGIISGKCDDIPHLNSILSMLNSLMEKLENIVPT